MPAEQKINLLDERIKIAERLRKAREAQGLTQTALAKDAGIARSTLVHYETGKAVPGGIELRKLGEALGVSPNFILSGSEQFFQSTAPEHALSVDDLNAMIARVSVCLVALERPIRESISELVMTLVRQKLGDADYAALVKAMDVMIPMVQELAPSMQQMTDEMVDEKEREGAFDGLKE